MYLSHFQKFLPTNKMAAIDGQPKLTICDVLTIFQCEYWKFMMRGLKGMQVEPEKHVINFFFTLMLKSLLNNLLTFLK